MAGFPGKAGPGLAGIFATLACWVSLDAAAQVPVDENGNPIEPVGLADEPIGSSGDAEALSTAELETLVGPIALYPDDLLAIVLPASTYPLEIVQAARFLEAHENDDSLKPDEEWDESVVALLNYPDVVKMMDEDIDWTWKLGDAVINQQQGVIAAVEAFRDRAYAAGNLKSDERQTVSNDDGVIEIEPVEDDVIYVPYYEPERVVVRQTRPVYYYYPRPCPVYYYPYTAGYGFPGGYFWGVTTAFRIGWAGNYLSIHHPSYYGHPYYGHYYYGNYYYRRPSITVYNSLYVNHGRRSSSHHYYRYRHRDGDHWRSRRHAGSRPSEYRSRTRAYGDDRSRGYDRPRDRRSVSASSFAGRDRSTGARRATNTNDARSARNLRQRTDAGRSTARGERTAVGQRAENRNDIRFRQRPNGNGNAVQQRDRRVTSQQRIAAERRSKSLNGRSQTTLPARRTQNIASGSRTRSSDRRTVRRESGSQPRRVQARDTAPAQIRSTTRNRPAQSVRQQRRASPPARQRQEARSQPRQQTQQRRVAPQPQRQQRSVPTQQRSSAPRTNQRATQNSNRSQRSSSGNRDRRSSGNRERRTQRRQ